MNKRWIIILAAFVALLILIQFYQPAKNEAKSATEDDIVYHVSIPAHVKKKLVSACYDCHSNKTHYPFYARIAPVSWIIGSHIKNGKENLNFSEWARYDKRKQLKILSEICDEVKSGDMPIRGYVFMHSSAIINEKELADICTWTETAAEEVLNNP